MQNDECEEQPVSFQELKKKWAMKESKSFTQEQQQSNVQSATSRSPTLGSTFSETTIAAPPALTTGASNVSDSLTPLPIPERSQTPLSLLPPSETKAPRSSSPKRVSLLAQQFRNEPHPKHPNGNFPSLPPPASEVPGSEDPFHDDEATSVLSDSGSETDSNGSLYNGTDDDLLRRLELVRMHNESSGLETLPNNGTTEKPLRPDTGKSLRSPPPPPPPSKKYHSAARVAPPSQNGSGQENIPKDAGPLPSEPATKPSFAPPPILPPRPVAHTELRHAEFSPLLPPRRSLSTLGQPRTVPTDFSLAGHNLSPSSTPSASQDELRRSHTVSTGPRRVLSRSEISVAQNAYPDISNASRNPPLIDYERRVNSHRGSIHALASAGLRFATGSHTTRIWDARTCQCLHTIDSSAPNEPNDKVRSLAFAPSRNPRQEGQRLWIGLHDGTLMVVNAMNGEILVKRSTNHRHPVVFIMRHRNTELWSLDEAGVLNVWDTLADDCEHAPPHEFHTAAKAVAALIVNGEIWTSSGRTLDVGRTLNANTPSHTRIPKDHGNITSLTTIPYHANQIFASHDDGRISAWDITTFDRIHTVMASMYGISAIACVGEYFLWAGLTSGRICVYDTRPTRWVLVKAWPAHKGAVTSLIVDESSFAADDMTIQVISSDSNGCACVWDGLMIDAWKDRQLQKSAQEYCTYNDTQVMICSWNIDANKPEKLIGGDDVALRKWLHGVKDPDIIVVGIQEIVDLESKKQTARLLFSSRKKSDAPQDEEELLTHRYRLWHDHLVNLVGDNYGHDVYTVLKTDQLVGLFSCVFVKSSERDRVIDCESTVVKTGLKVLNKSLHGNKGGIAIRFLLDHSSLCFVNCHLAAGQSHKEDRNANADTILQTGAFLKKDYFDVFANGGDGGLIMDHEHCFLSGDLNYRIDMDRKKVLRFLAGMDKEDSWIKLQEEDQLMKQRSRNSQLKLLLFDEAPIRFDPTYKYDPGTDNYDQSEKQRVPAWCDRVLFRSPAVQNLYYTRHEVRASDHRPISAGFVIQTKVIDEERRNRVLEKVVLLWHQQLERIVQQKKAYYVADYGLCSVQEATVRLSDANWSVEHVVAGLFQQIR